MRFAIVSGSHRPNSQSAKVARFAAAQLVNLDPSFTAYVLDLGMEPLPLWEEGIWKKEPKMVDAWRPVAEELTNCVGLVVVAPEWSGMAPAALKNFFLFASDGSLYHKPGMLIGVSSSRNGAYPIAELRMSSYKNSHVQYISEQVVVRHVADVLNDPEPQSDEDGSIRRRLDYSLRVFVEYAKALRMVRDSGVLNRKDFPFSM